MSFILSPSFTSGFSFLCSLSFKLIYWPSMDLSFPSSFFLGVTLIFPCFYLYVIDKYIFKFLSLTILVYFSLGCSYISFLLWEHIECFIFIVWKRRSMDGLQEVQKPSKSLCKTCVCSCVEKTHPFQNFSEDLEGKDINFQCGQSTSTPRTPAHTASPAL